MDNTFKINDIVVMMHQKLSNGLNKMVLILKLNVKIVDEKS